MIPVPHAAGFAPAKVNLYLHVTGRRPDGYHLLDSLVVFADVGDEVAAAPAETLSLTVDGAGAEALAAEADNLVLRAARALAEAAGIAPRAALRLTKILPVAAGLGGGSADAAAALRVLRTLWGLSLDDAALSGIARRIGADVPACLAARPCRMEGIGEVLGPAPALPRFGLVLANPRVALATPAVFAARQGAFSPRAVLPVGWADADAMARDLAAQANDLEPPARALCPAIGDVLAALRALPGVLLARMSGSGATCFALMATPAEAAQAATRL
ncbi:MAG TPA: 4-(cytidine 5'-diphospho)-2-C-methyl-D-erythritol kinase, partial [Acetobacteraceae bacterium]|nr:4-(cytidine 5'-diphospho)-2-C-methyl-D-erythritol kinase [Acetobacteraceae bacterium]